MYRLTNEVISGASPTGNLGYRYDDVGNRTNRIGSVGALTAQTFSYNANDQLGADLYDSNGNTTNSAGNPYRYDFENRLTNYKNRGAVYVYDGDGNRVGMEVGATTTIYLVDDKNPTGYAQVLEELISNGGTTNLSRSYTYGQDLISQRQVSNGTVSFYGYDGHGSTRFLTTANGTITDTYTYDVYGSLIASNVATANVYLYCGEQLDPTLGLYHLGVRELNPATGRFWTSDTWEGRQTDPLSLHRYLYCQADPVNHIDPSGNEIEGLLAAIDFGGMLAQIGASSFASISAVITSSDAWNVQPHDVDVNQPGLSLVASSIANPQGFWVTYKPALADSRDNKVVLYQIWSASGLRGFSARVDTISDNATAPATGSPMPPEMRLKADSSISYQDSPTCETTGILGVTTFKLTAVAVRRTKDVRGGDRLLSTYCFEFDNKPRKITRQEPDSREHYEAGIKLWWGN